MLACEEKCLAGLSWHEDGGKGLFLGTADDQHGKPDLQSTSAVSIDVSHTQWKLFQHHNDNHVENQNNSFDQQMAFRVWSVDQWAQQNESKLTVNRKTTLPWPKSDATSHKTNAVVTSVRHILKCLSWQKYLGISNKLIISMAECGKMLFHWNDFFSQCGPEKLQEEASQLPFHQMGSSWHINRFLLYWGVQGLGHWPWHWRVQLTVFDGERTWIQDADSFCCATDGFKTLTVLAMTPMGSGYWWVSSARMAVKEQSPAVNRMKKGSSFFGYTDTSWKAEKQNKYA